MRMSLSVFTALAALAGATQAQQLVAPINMTWRASSETTSSSTTTAIMRTTLYHTQLMYDNSHFVSQGVSGPITINRLRFRAEDTEPNLGGQVFSNVAVRLSDTAAGITTATMSTTFATNVGTNVGTTETLATITMAPARGTIPNDYVVDIPLTTGAFTYDPTTMGCLLVDITSPTAPVPATSIAPLACVTTQATHLARGNSSTTSGAATGTLTASVPVCLFSFSGPGGTVAIIPASTVSLGAGGGGHADSFYQFFGAGEPFDLQGRSFRVSPNGGFTAYTVTGGTTAPDLSKAVTLASTADDAVTTLAMGWTFTFVGGSTSTIKPCTNGFVWLNSAATSTDLSPTVAELLGGGSSAYPARVAMAWYDMQAGRNLTSHPGSGMYADVDTSGGAGNNVTYVTWREIGQFNSVSATGGHSVNTYQLVLFESSMEMELRFGAMTGLLSGTAITGFSPGTRGSSINSVDSGSRDLSCEVPFVTTGPDGAPNETLSASGRAYVNNPVTLTASNIPVADNFGVFVFDLTALCPGLVGAPLASGCMLSVFPPTVLMVASGFPPGGPTSSVPLTAPPGSDGGQLFFQFLSFDFPALTAIHSSNTLGITAGLR